MVNLLLVIRSVCKDDTITNHSVLKQNPSMSKNTNTRSLKHNRFNDFQGKTIQQIQLLCDNNPEHYFRPNNQSTVRRSMDDTLNGSVSMNWTLCIKQSHIESQTVSEPETEPESIFPGKKMHCCNRSTNHDIRWYERMKKEIQSLLTKEYVAMTKFGVANAFVMLTRQCKLQVKVDQKDMPTQRKIFSLLNTLI